jgi:hypothetical protein
MKRHIINQGFFVAFIFGPLSLFWSSHLLLQ